MNCCGKVMYDDGGSLHCSICGKRIYKPKAATSGICPKCGQKLFINGNNIHCAKCEYREYFKG
ncbi:hypothetical protein [Clostridium sp. AM58-1XD]|uniref:hypothetical protein n=1 Tax=Clostridium sp. AM58-1XD TaxID=2292307 RepID=UPI0011C179AB|nr:hypothetical protein [Clostridium sp. AM58-1XD]